MDTVINNIIARISILKGGKYSIEVDVITPSGFGRFASPLEADPMLYLVEAYRGVSEVDEIIGPELIGFDSQDQELIDSYLWEIDGTEDFSHVGANTALAISIAVAKAASNSKGIPLYRYIGGTFSTEIPVPMVEFGRDENFRYLAVVRDITEIRDVLDGIVKIEEFAKTCTLEELSEASELASEELGIDVGLGLVQLKPFELEELLGIVENNNVAYIKPLSDEEEVYLELMAETHGVFIDGENLFRAKDILDRRYYNALSIKPINFGTLTDVYNIVNDAKSEKITPIMAEATFESADEALVHLAVGLKSPAVILNKDSLVKMNELIRIAEDLGERARIITFEG
ncbi:hypothetical protein PAP_01940 [Palaeococcus pacificus DY20341]|uniref:phosphopyruvate hydratase n=1 Tax=Palaeococcus pacificus DY20341 TaxID=1343739 RepID=A0A075LQ44_9EURY|nr:hypothetical protein [Palaeococcus pacificus]AIF68820.1 hypothetical protein PAP_01940 [Palaeococcus pacificus DY20341]